MDSMEINAAIEKLLTCEKFDFEAAAIVIAYGKTIPLSNDLHIEIKSKSNGKSNFRGFAEGIGGVEYEFNEKKSFEKTFGRTIARVGHYKIYRTSFIGLSSIHIRHFWKSDKEMECAYERKISEYQLMYNQKNEKVISFSRTGKSSKFTFILLPIPFIGIVHGIARIERNYHIFGRHAGKNISESLGLTFTLKK